VYQDKLMPELHGQYFVCEPAQNLVHRAQIERDGTRLRLKRLPQEEKSEFLASTDPWFHPVGLQSTPDGSIAIIDFYREIIEDYSAIPRHLQQQYGVINGHDRGRIWLLTKEGHKPALSTPMASLDDAALVKELASDLQWRRRTAQRLLVERMSTFVPDVDTLASADVPTWTFAVRTFATRDILDPGWEHRTIAMGMLLDAAWEHSSPRVRLEPLRIADLEFADKGLGIEESLLATNFTAETPPELALQAALSLGQTPSPDKLAALTRLARSHGDLRWMDAAIASSAYRIEKDILASLAKQPGKGEPVMINLAGVIAARGDPKEIRDSITALESADSTGKPLEILKLGLEETKPLTNKVDVPTPAAPTAEQLAAWEKRVPEVIAALKQKPNLEEGRTLFQGICAACHRSHGLGVAVGPDLDAEFQRAPEVILRDVLFPSEAARPGFETMMAKTQRGETLIGVVASDSPTSITLRLTGGVERTVLRKRASISTIRNVSLMPAGLGDALKPEQIANIIAFLRSPSVKAQ
jgi:putative heme-binding domain-containing protein